jgi:ribosomal protein L37AE/L43A
LKVRFLPLNSPLKHRIDDVTSTSKSKAVKTYGRGLVALENAIGGKKMNSEHSEEKQAEQLKPCPFCGSDDVELDGETVFWVECHACGSRVCGATREIATGAWNIEGKA